MGERQRQGLLEAQPGQVGVLGAAQSRLAVSPGRDHEDVILGLPVLGGMRLGQHRDPFECPRPDADLFHELPGERVDGRLVPLAVSADDVPHTWIEVPIGRASFRCSSENSIMASPGISHHPTGPLPNDNRPT